MVPAAPGVLMMSAPDGSFRSAARADASSGVRDSAGAGFAGGRADFCFAVELSDLLGGALGAAVVADSADGRVVSAAGAERPVPAMAKPRAITCRITRIL